MQKIKWGVLGYAKIATREVIPGIFKAANSEYYAQASRDPEKLRQAREEFGCKKLYAGYEELLDDPEVQAVYIPLPNSMHKEWCLKAAQRGKHVLCEKPIALNAKEAEEMRTACRENKVKLMEAFMYRYTPRTKKVQEILKSGVLGEIKFINSSFRFFLDRKEDYRLDPRLGGGSLYDVGCYPLNFVGMVVGRSPISIKAEAVIEKGVDVLFSGVLRYDNGIIAGISSGFNAFTRIYSEIIGTEGVLEAPDTFLGGGNNIILFTANGRKEFSVENVDRYQLEIEDFADAIINDREPFFGMDETIRNMEIMDELRKEIQR